MKIPAPGLRYAADSDWELYRDIIVSYYLEDALPLKEVMRLMHEQHGFRSTAKVYKTKLSEWNVQKYLKVKQRDDALRLVDEFKSEYGYCPTITLNRRHVSISRLKRRPGSAAINKANVEPHKSPKARRHIRVMSSNTIELGQAALPNEAAVQPIDQLPVPSPNRLLMPSSDAGDVGKVLQCTKAFTTYCAETYFPTQAHMFSFRCEPRARGKNCGLDGYLAPSQAAADFWSSLIVTLNELEMLNYSGAFAELEKGCKEVAAFMDTPPTSIFRYLLLILGNCRWEHYAEVRQQILLYLAQMASEKLGDSHPVAIALYELKKPGTILASAEMMMRIATQEVEGRFGSTHIETLWFKRSLARILKRQGEAIVAETLLQTAKRQCELATGPYSQPTRLCLEGLGQLYMQEGRLEDAEAILTELVRKAENKCNTDVLVTIPGGVRSPGVWSPAYECSPYACDRQVDTESGHHFDAGCGIDHGVLYAKRNLSFLAQVRGDNVLKDYWLAQELKMIRENNIDENWSMARRRYQEKRFWETGTFRYMTQLKGHVIRMGVGVVDVDGGQCDGCTPSWADQVPTQRICYIGGV